MNRILFIALIAAVAVSCELPPGASNATTVVTGTVTVADAAYWAYVKIGLFSGGDAGATPISNLRRTWGP